MAFPRVLETLQSTKYRVMPRQPQLGTYHALNQKRATLSCEFAPLNGTERLSAWTRRVRTNGALGASEPAEAVGEAFLVSLLPFLPLLVKHSVRVNQTAFHGSIKPHIKHPRPEAALACGVITGHGREDVGEAGRTLVFLFSSFLFPLFVGALTSNLLVPAVQGNHDLLPFFLNNAVHCLLILVGADSIPPLTQRCLSLQQTATACLLVA